MSRSAVSSVVSPEELRFVSRGTSRPSPARRRALVGAVLMSADAVACAIALLMVWIFGHLAGFPAGSLGLAVPGVGLAIAAFWLAGLYTGNGPSPFERVRLRAFAVVAFAALELGLQAAVGAGGLIRSLLLAPGLLFLAHVGELVARDWLERRGLWRTRVLIFGEASKAEQLATDLLARPILGLRPVAILSPLVSGTPPSGGASIIAGLPCITSLPASPEPIDCVVVIGATSLAAFERMTARSGEVESVMLLSECPSGESLWVPTRSLGAGLGVEVRQSRRLDRSDVIKRGLDLFIAVLVGVPASLIIGAAALAVRTVDPGPVFYRQKRIGRDGKPFDVLKIRSMYQDAEQRLKTHLANDAEARREWDRFMKLRNDPRVLPMVGAFIRKSSIDELPQIWNIVRGDMSLVGPRPFPDYHVKRFDEEFQSLRASVQPGLTGLWQVSGRSEADLDKQKAEDLFYIRNRSLWMDLYILLQTLPAVIGGRGAS